MSTSSRRSSLWRWIRRALVAFVVLPLLWIVLTQLYTRHITAREVQEAIAETDAADSGWRFEELEAARAVVADDQNGALQVRAADRLLSNPWPPPARPPAEGVAVPPPQTQPSDRGLHEMILTLEPQMQLTDEQTRRLRDALEETGPAVTLARKLTDFRTGRAAVDWRVDYLHIRLPHADAARRVGALLIYDAALRAQDQDVEGAWTSGRACIHAARSLGDEPLLITMLARTALVLEGVGSLERTLGQGEPREALLASAQQLLQKEEEETPALVLNALRGERALFHRLLEAVDRGDLSITEGFAEKPSSASYWTKLGEMLNVGKVRHSHAVALRQMGALVDVCRLPLPAQPAALRELAARRPDRDTAPFAWLMMPALTKVIETVPRKQAALRCAVVALALERYRQKHHRWPPSLAALVPAQLEQIPADPYDGEPVRFRLLGDGVVVYSVGPDGKDDGGNLNRELPTAPGSDLGFRLWDVAKRRQQPPPEPAPEGR
jgi:hypothetical protein